MNLLLQPLSKAAPTPTVQQQKAARALSAQFIEMMVKPLLKREDKGLGGDSAWGNSHTSSTLIEPMMTESLSKTLAQGNALGLYPLFLKAIEKKQEALNGGNTRDRSTVSEA